VIGGVQRGLAVRAPFRIAGRAEVESAHVYLNEIPCDFLAWEHLSWECSHYDAGSVYNLVGLASSKGINIGGKRVSMLLVPSGRDGETRTVSWSHVQAGKLLKLRWGVPDGLLGGGTARIFLNDQQAFEFDLSAHGDGIVHESSLSTRQLAGKKVRLRIEVKSIQDPGAPAVLAIDGGWG
jgi:hypothetical protein